MLIRFVFLPVLVSPVSCVYQSALFGDSCIVPVHLVVSSFSLYLVLRHMKATVSMTYVAFPFVMWLLLLRTHLFCF